MMVFSELLDLLYPPVCKSCNSLLEEGVQLLCLNCRKDLHRTNYHLVENNPIEMHFAGRLKIELASSFLHFKKGSRIQKIMHQVKYHREEELAILMGKICAIELKQCGFFDSIDVLVPVPLHPDKLKIRGYNQANLIAEGISSISGVELRSNLLTKVLNTPSQTNKTRMERFENVSNSFEVQNYTDIQAKHILLIDDVITTGSTLEACAIKLLEVIEGSKLSVLTLAAAD